MAPLVPVDEEVVVLHAAIEVVMTVPPVVMVDPPWVTVEAPVMMVTGVGSHLSSVFVFVFVFVTLFLVFLVVVARRLGPESEPERIAAGAVICGASGAAGRTAAGTSRPRTEEPLQRTRKETASQLRICILAMVVVRAVVVVGVSARCEDWLGLSAERGQMAQ